MADYAILQRSPIPETNRKDFALNRKLQSTLLIGLITLSLGTAATAQDSHSHGEHVMVVPSELKWMDVPSLPPGAKLAVIEGPVDQAGPFTMRLKFPANYILPAHSHPVVERCTVLSGTFYMGVGDKIDKTRSRPLPAGGIAIMPAGMTHFAYTEEETIVQLDGRGPWGIMYVNADDDPRRN